MKASYKNASKNKCVFRFFLKLMIDFEFFTWRGILFHKIGAATQKLVAPLIFWILSCESPCVEERSPLYPGIYDSIRSVRYVCSKLLDQPGRIVSSAARCVKSTLNNITRVNNDGMRCWWDKNTVALMTYFCWVWNKKETHDMQFGLGCVYRFIASHFHATWL